MLFQTKRLKDFQNVPWQNVRASSTKDYSSRAIYISNLLTALHPGGAFEQWQDYISHTSSPPSPLWLSHTGKQNTTYKAGQCFTVGHDELASCKEGANDNIRIRVRQYQFVNCKKSFYTIYNEVAIVLLQYFCLYYFDQCCKSMGGTALCQCLI